MVLIIQKLLIYEIYEYQKLTVTTLNSKLNQKDVLINGVIGLYS